MIKVTEAITLLLDLLDRAAQVSQMIATAHVNGQANLDSTQLANIIAADDVARKKLSDAMAAAAVALAAKPSPGSGGAQ